MKKQGFRLIYVDAFAGEGYWSPNSPYVSEDYGDFDGVREGSSRIALGIQDRPFDHLVFIEKNPKRYESLQTTRQDFPDRSIDIINDDANREMISFRNALGNFERGVVFLDPFAPNSLGKLCRQ